MKNGDCFAIEHGKYIGKCIVLIKDKGQFYYFLMMPGDFKVLQISKFDFNKAKGEIENKSGSDLKFPPFINFIETIPDEVFKVVKAQYDITIKNKLNIVSDIFANK